MKCRVPTHGSAAVSLRNCHNCFTGARLLDSFAGVEAAEVCMEVVVVVERFRVIQPEEEEREERWRFTREWFIQSEGDGQDKSSRRLFLGHSTTEQ